jgi:membrane fusion protein, multidrug efflux system
MRRRAQALLALGELGLAVTLAGCGHGGGEKAAQADTRAKVVPVTVAPLERRSVERTVEVVGTLRGWEDVTIGAKRVGRVAKIHHDMGDRVPPNALLVELESVDADLAVEQADRQLQAELAKLGLNEFPQGKFDVACVPAVVQAKVALDRAKNIYNRERQLMQRGAGATETYQNAETDEKAAEAALANAILSAEATLASAHATRVALVVAKQARIDTEIRAPVPSMLPKGVTEPIQYAVSKRSVAEGQMLTQGDAVIELVIENPLRLWANVPERSSAAVKLGQPVRVTVASHPGTDFAGTVARINPAVDPVSRTFQVEAAIPNNRGMLRPGGFAKASILTDRSAEAAIVPIGSVVRFAGVTKLFVVEGEHARAIPVETDQEGPGWIEVNSKGRQLPARAQVVTTGQTQLADGTPVVIRAEESSPDAAPKSEARAPTPAGAGE